MSWCRRYRIKCPYCDAEVDSDDLFCGECGKRLPGRARKERKMGMPLIVGIAAAVVVGCVVVGMVTFVLAGGILPLLPVATPIPTPSHTPSPVRGTLTPTLASPSPVPGADPYEPDNTIAEAQPITTDGSVQAHNLHTQTDHDYSSFVADGGTSYTIETMNLGLNIDTVIYLYDDQGNQLASNDDGGAEPVASRIIWIAPSGGTYYVMTKDLGEDSSGADAIYEILVTSGGAGEGADTYEPDDSMPLASQIDTDGTYQTHTFHTTTDVDYVWFISQEGIEYTIETGNLQGECDTALYLYDVDGVELEYDDDAGDESYASRIVWTAPSSEIYYVGIVDYRDQAGSEVSYQIWASTQTRYE
ncbi:MAG: pre-peptidase C-terminal domain-containing protein [Anaerolineae bacterium]